VVVVLIGVLVANEQILKKIFKHQKKILLLVEYTNCWKLCYMIRSVNLLATSFPLSERIFFGFPNPALIKISWANLTTLSPALSGKVSPHANPVKWSIKIRQYLQKNKKELRPKIGARSICFQKNIKFKNSCEVQHCVVPCGLEGWEQWGGEKWQGI